MRINGNDNNISRIERGLYNFNVVIILVLANALEVTLNELLDIKNIDFLIKNILEDVGFKQLTGLFFKRQICLVLFQ